MSASGYSPRFALATFMRVFDTEPKRDIVGLDELTYGLTRFILKPKLHRAIERDLERIDQAYAAWESGENPGGQRFHAIRTGAREGGLVGARSAYEQLARRARARAKTDLRLWSPALYREGARRDSEQVVSVSCLSLDFDSGIAPEKASEDWSRWYHIVHSTWSHKPEHPKFRLVLPLQRPVLRDDWRDFWEWAAERSGSASDPALKSAGSTFALPATPNRRAPRVSFVHAGALLDPLAEGLVREAAPPPPELPSQPASHFRGTDPSEETLADIAVPRPPVLPSRSDRPTLEDFDLFGPHENAAVAGDSSGNPQAKAQGDAATDERDDDEWADQFDKLF